MAEPDFLRITRASYDTIAVDFAEQMPDEVEDRPMDRALLALFAEFVRSAGGGPVADIGCGYGRVTGYLHGLGLDVFGIDLSPGMLEVGRRAHPQLRFEIGSMTDLDIPDDTLDGLVAYYSIIHIPAELLPRVMAEFHRVLAPGGHALIVFQVGDEPLHLSEALGHVISLDFHRRRPEHIAELLVDAGLEVYSQTVREPEDSRERTPQAYILARKPADLALEPLHG